MMGRERGSLQFIPEKAKMVLETPSAMETVLSPNSHSFIHLHLTDHSEILVQGSDPEQRFKSYNEEEEEGLTLR